jgi:hypothetical protein
LRLIRCGIGVAGARFLGSALARNNNGTLRELYLGSNFGIGNEGAMLLGDALRSNTSLRKLSLSNCNINTEGLVPFAAALSESNESLQVLTLEPNNFRKSNASWKTIQRCMEENRSAPEEAERRARCLLFCCLKLAPQAHKFVVPSIGAVPVPVMRYAVEHCAELVIAKRFSGSRGPLPPSRRGSTAATRPVDASGSGASSQGPAQRRKLPSSFW